MTDPIPLYLHPATGVLYAVETVAAIDETWTEGDVMHNRLSPERMTFSMVRTRGGNGSDIELVRVGDIDRSELGK